jgi:methyl-accepting chemotaxis protein
MEQAESIGRENQELVSSLTDYAEKVHGAFETVTNTTQDAAAAAQELSATSEEVSASATSVAHSIQQQSESIAELSLMAETLNRSSETLNNLVCQFSVSDSNIIELSAA